MLKIWKGIEKEGIGLASEVPTLFVCSNVELAASDIIKWLQQEPSIVSIYFGAGRMHFAGMNPREWHSLLKYCREHNIKIIIEVRPMMMELFAKLYNDALVTFIIAYYNAPKQLTNLFFKTDDYITTRIYTSAKEVDITMVADDRYPDDKVLYEEDDK